MWFTCGYHHDEDVVGDDGDENVVDGQDIRDERDDVDGKLMNLIFILVGDSVFKLLVSALSPILNLEVILSLSQSWLLADPDIVTCGFSLSQDFWSLHAETDRKKFQLLIGILTQIAFLKTLQE